MFSQGPLSDGGRKIRVTERDVTRKAGVGVMWSLEPRKIGNP